MHTSYVFLILASLSGIIVANNNSSQEISNHENMALNVCKEDYIPRRINPLWASANLAIGKSIDHVALHPEELTQEIEKLEKHPDLIAFKALSDKEKLAAIVIDYHEHDFQGSDKKTQIKEAVKAFYAIHNLSSFGRYQDGTASLKSVHQDSNSAETRTYLRNDLVTKIFHASKTGHEYLSLAEECLNEHIAQKKQ